MMHSCKQASKVGLSGNERFGCTAQHFNQLLNVIKQQQHQRTCYGISCKR